jgi:hypothetical protein
LIDQGEYHVFNKRQDVLDELLEARDDLRFAGANHWDWLSPQKVRLQSDPFYLLRMISNVGPNDGAITILRADGQPVDLGMLAKLPPVRSLTESLLNKTVAPFDADSKPEPSKKTPPH